MINVGLGAAIGAVIRYIITSWWKKLRIDWPLATLFINITGSFLLGILTKDFASNSSIMLLFGIGLLGGYTTFSTFNVELISMMDERRWGMFAVYFGLSYLGGVIATICGMMI
ncbi:fluoride efflux transporter FluC [Limosilactobacillus reuteri]|uniref:fluoride efflux transporter FluC n=1 Tax=Limosilactobacillus reuteri TaxID=1598 RepID=UPI00128AE843|nr:CrcB family protein [Limosilactobacillus reuteri]MQB59321.1 camphor resistance protein CrcB [Limosilactobacillus reuteri]MQB67599.1 camphor resistance protein CrcB [Limosilactobacillus reuteri]MQB78779.1 camphor resistance protein CrcB [Limosilactobacillus reuteri]MQB82738.1 camphor resistance protein CrcB [Limosilactobacillus reuteri]MQB97072.1 camphor resistance protein CrcB [Limosilactobacillus reuteri]